VDPKTFQLVQDLRFTIGFDEMDEHLFVIKKGFKTNLRSGTDLINGIIPKMGPETLTCAYILHDALYTDHFFCRKTADEILIALMKWEGTIGAIKRSLISTTLSLFGGSAYNEKCTGVYEGNENHLSVQNLTLDGPSNEKC